MADLNVANLWIVLTSNNRGSFDECDQLFLSELDARIEAEFRNRCKIHDRHDWIVITLSDAIQEKIDDSYDGCRE